MQMRMHRLCESLEVEDGGWAAAADWLPRESLGNLGRIPCEFLAKAQHPLALQVSKLAF